MVGTSGGELCIGGAVLLGGFDVVNEIDESIECCIPQSEEAVLDVFNPRFQLVFGKVVAGLAGTVDLEQRAVDLVIADF